MGNKCHENLETYTTAGPFSYCTTNYAVAGSIIQYKFKVLSFSGLLDFMASGFISPLDQNL
jgi:hypothetical protein